MQDRDLALAFLPGKGPSNRRRCCCCCSCCVLCSLRHVINHPVCACVCVCACTVCVCLCVCVRAPPFHELLNVSGANGVTNLNLASVLFGSVIVTDIRLCRSVASRRVAVVVCDKTNQFKAAAESAAELKSLISGALKQQQQQQQLLQRKQLQLQQQQVHYECAGTTREREPIVNSLRFVSFASASVEITTINRRSLCCVNSDADADAVLLSCAQTSPTSSALPTVSRATNAKRNCYATAH